MAKQTRRKRGGRHRGTESRANADLQAHIASLGLATEAEYRRWCRDHGFSGALNKDWRERRQERQSARKTSDAAQAEEEALGHIRALGLDSTAAYRQWCRGQGLGDALHKSPRQRQKELELLRQLRSESALARDRSHTRRPADTIKGLFEGRIEAAGIGLGYLRQIADAAKDVQGDDERSGALCELLLHVERRASLFDQSPAIGRFGSAPGNTFIDGLAALCRHRGDWIRPLKQWRPDSHNPRRQFSSLARHLVAAYEVPAFMDSVWFRGDTDVAAQQQGWFLHVGGGGNIRTAAIPVSLTKKMAHCFLQAPDGYSVEEALRWGQILGRDGDQGLVEVVVGTRLVESFEHEDFWETVIHWLVANPMLDPDWVGPIIDFIQQQKYEPQEIATPGGDVEHRDPPQPNFSMKSRSVLKLLRQVEEWHDQLTRETRIPATQWERSAIGELTCSEREEGGEGQQLTWSIREILTTKELNAEGRAMHHCVRSYANNCRKGKTAIFSLQVADAEGASARLMTVAVNPRTRMLTQVRGRYNARPNGSFEQGQKKRGMGPDYRARLRSSRAILHRWVEREELSWGSRA